jgi:hypothetical protein
VQYFSGLDLGQQADFSALVTLEQRRIPDPDCSGQTVNRFDVRLIHRWELRTPYPKIVEDLHEWYERSPLKGTTLVVDGTGCGRPVVDMIRSQKIAANVRAYTITAGSTPGDETVPKIDLVGAVSAALQTSRLRIAERLSLASALGRELETFRVKVTADRNETFAALREKDHDDLVIALALAVWYGERHGGGGNWRPPTYTTPPLIPRHLGTLKGPKGWGG